MTKGFRDRGIKWHLQLSKILEFYFLHSGRVYVGNLPKKNKTPQLSKAESIIQFFELENL